jgi:hypothetical protein
MGKFVFAAVVEHGPGGSGQRLDRRQIEREARGQHDQQRDDDHPEGAVAAGTA